MGEYQQPDLATSVVRRSKYQLWLRSKLTSAINVIAEGVMSKFRAYIFAVICVLFSPLAGADEEVGGPYIGVSVGQGRVNAQDLAQQNADHLAANGYLYADIDSAQSSAGYKLYWGYQFNRYLATELIYSYLGSFNMSGHTVGPTYNLNGNTKAMTAGLDMVGMIPFTTDMSGLVRLGYVKGKNETSVSFEGGGSTSWTDHKSGAKYGLGAEWQLAKLLHLRIEAEYYYSNPSDRIRMISIGVR
jgi:OmpA-OmpF porin, OOP family